MMDHAHPQAHTYGQYPHAPHMQATYSNGGEAMARHYGMVFELTKSVLPGYAVAIDTAGDGLQILLSPGTLSGALEDRCTVHVRDILGRNEQSV